MGPTMTVTWTDGSRWSADTAVFAQVSRLLDGLRPVMVGLDPVLNRWDALARAGSTLAVDAFAATEDDRAVFTAALDRAVEEARRPGGQPDSEPGERATLLGKLAELHELFATDITHR